MTILKLTPLLFIRAGKDEDTINLLSNYMHTVYGGLGADTINSSSTKSMLINGGSDKDTITLTGVPSGELFTQLMVAKVATL